MLTNPALCAAPVSSVKGLLYQDYMNGPEDVRRQFYTDPMLANGNGHDRACPLSANPRPIICSTDRLPAPLQ